MVEGADFQTQQRISSQSISSQSVCCVAMEVLLKERWQAGQAGQAVLKDLQTDQLPHSDALPHKSEAPSNHDLPALLHATLHQYLPPSPPQH